MNTSSRSAHAQAILGSALYSQLPNTKVLLVGAGGIGCELLKNIVLVGFGHITLLDLDTIDLSNLNRQFLFRKKDVKQSKALVAAQTAGAFNPSVHITPLHGNIKEPQYDVDWFKQFDIVLNALDNLDARRHVNKMCLAASIPLVESGTAGYLGQVQPILKDKTECFDCIPKPTPRSFPVCTIRSTPSQPIHCIVWAKSYLLSQLFGEDEDAGATNDLDEAEKQGENAQEIATLRREAQAFQAVRQALRSGDSKENEEAAKMAFRKVFNADIQNLLSMADMWRSRAPPQPLDFDAIMDDKKNASVANFASVPGSSTKSANGHTTAENGKGAETADGGGKPKSKGRAKNAQTPTNSPSKRGKKAKEQGSTPIRKSTRVAERAAKNGIEIGHTPAGDSNTNMNSAATSAPKGQPVSGPSGLKDQQSLTIKENLELFVSSTNALAKRLRAGEQTISFDKDDDDTLDFVTATANLRGFTYGIETKTRWEIKEMAGNIIPAIATTNAVVSGLIVLQALHLLRATHAARSNPLQAGSSTSVGTHPSAQPYLRALRNVHIQFKPAVPLSAIRLCAPDPKCGVCRDTYVDARCDAGKVTLGEIVAAVLKGTSAARKESQEDAMDEEGGGEREVSVYEGTRVLSDPDWKDNHERTLESLGVTRGKFLTIVDEDGEWGTLGVGISELPPNHPVTDSRLILGDPLPALPRIQKLPAQPAQTLEPAQSRKRAAPDDEIAADHSAKRMRTTNGAEAEDGADLVSPSKRRMLEDDGLLLMDSSTGAADVIEID